MPWQLSLPTLVTDGYGHFHTQELQPNSLFTYALVYYWHTLVWPRAYRAAEGGERACKPRIVHVDGEILIVTKNTLPFAHVLSSIRWVYGRCKSYPDNCADKRSRVGNVDRSTWSLIIRRSKEYRSLLQVAVQTRKKYHQIQQRHSPCPATARRLLLSKLGSANSV